MQRGKPLKRTPLKRGTGSLKRSPLNPRSKRTKEIYVERRAIVEDMLKSFPQCQACVLFYVFDTLHACPPHISPAPLGVVRQNKTVDIHELINRSQGGSITDTMNLLAVCRRCHNRITTNPKEAETLGLHLESWCNTVSHFKEAERVRLSWSNGIPTTPNWSNDE